VNNADLQCEYDSLLYCILNAKLSVSTKLNLTVYFRSHERLWIVLRLLSTRPQASTSWPAL